MRKTIKVLMVDDERQFRKTTKRILSKRGFDIILADSSETAIRALEENPDVVVLDVKMPGMDGHQTLKEIKRQVPDLPVIMLTGHGARPSAEKALAQGAFDYLSKPCDIDILAAKITEAYQHGSAPRDVDEKRVRDVMIPIGEYTTLTEESTIQDAIEQLRASFSPHLSTDKIMETGHRSLLVLDKDGRARGVLTIIDLLKALMPAYLTAAKPSMADSIHYSPMFWSGMFTREVQNLALKNIETIMSPAPLVIDAGANLMEAVDMMVIRKRRRLAVMDTGKIVGVVREQDLFFEIESILRRQNA